MHPAKILFKSPQLSLDKVNFSYTAVSTQKITPEIEAQAKQIWEEAYAGYQKAGANVWDGENYRVNSVSFENGVLELELSKVNFSKIVGYRDIIDDLPAEYGTNHLSIGTVLRTADGLFVLGKRSGKTATRSSIDMFGGIANLADIKLTAGRDIYTFLLKELNEELGLIPEHIKQSDLVGLVQSPSSNYILIFDTQLKLTRNELQALFLKKNDQEMKDLLFIPPADFAKLVATSGSYRVLLPQLLGLS